PGDSLATLHRMTLCGLDWFEVICCLEEALGRKISQREDEAIALRRRAACWRKEYSQFGQVAAVFAGGLRDAQLEEPFAATVSQTQDLLSARNAGGAATAEPTAAIAIER